jgi:hypothetical protein
MMDLAISCFLGFVDLYPNEMDYSRCNLFFASILFHYEGCVPFDRLSAGSIIELPEFGNCTYIVHSIYFFFGLIFEICNNLSQDWFA